MHMPEDSFWSIIDRTVSSNLEIQAKSLGKILKTLPPDEITAFRATYDMLLDRSFRWDLWGAAYVINDGCSDDGFDYFRDWLISRGRRVYETALARPEDLADEALPHDASFEDFRYVAEEVYMDLTGAEIDILPSELTEPIGAPFDEATVRDAYPRLASREVPKPKRKIMGPTDANGRPLWSLGQPLFTEENVRKFDRRLQAMVGRKLSSLDAIPQQVFLGLKPRKEDLTARAWTLALADGSFRHAARYVCEKGDPESLPAELRAAAGADDRTDAQIAEDTLAAFGPDPDGRVAISAATRLDGGAVRLEFRNAPKCLFLILHGGDTGRSGDSLGVRLHAAGETLCLSRLGVEVAIPGFGWAPPIAK